MLSPLSGPMLKLDFLIKVTPVPNYHSMKAHGRLATKVVLLSQHYMEVTGQLTLF